MLPTIRQRQLDSSREEKLAAEFSLCASSRMRQIALLLLGCTGFATLAASARAQNTALSVDATQTVRIVDERIFGVNATLWDKEASSDQTVSMLRAAGIRTIRMPGGSLSNEYHWLTNTTLTNTWTWDTGVSGFAQLIANLGPQTFLCVNYGTGTPEEAAAWVAYYNASASLLGTSSDVTIGVDAKGFDWKTAGFWASQFSPPQSRRAARRETLGNRQRKLRLVGN
jgi:hypothetical protein